MAKSKLKAVDPKTAAPSKPQILIFGKPGVGKTWGALDFPACYYIDTEGGANLPHYTDKLKASGGVYMGPEQGSQSFEEIIGQVQALATESHAFKTLVIDSVTKIFQLAIEEEAERLGSKNVFGADKKPAIASMRRLVSWLTRLDMNVILIAHEKPLWGVDSKGDRTEIGVTFDGWDKLEYELHLNLNIQKQGPRRVAQIKKTRLEGFPDATSFPWSYEEFATRYGKDVIEGEVKTITLATEEQLKEIHYLLGIVKLPDGTTDKWLKAANADSFEEMETGKLAGCIEALKKKVNPATDGEK